MAYEKGGPGVHKESRALFFPYRIIFIRFTT